MNIINFILCDDIRSELGNKKSLMGVYAKELLFTTTDGKDSIWPKNLNLAIMVTFSLSSAIKRNAKTFKVTYSLNNIEKELGRGEFILPTNEDKSEDSFEITIFANAQYKFEACGKLIHFVKIYDSLGKEIAKAKALNEFAIEERSN
jgi:hypothetical protein